MTKENKIIDDEIYEEKPTQEKNKYILLICRKTI